MRETKILALDVGAKRIGLATANPDIGIAYPLKIVANNQDIWDSIQSIIKHENITDIVVGLPRNLQGESTDQTRYTELFIQELRQRTQLNVYQQDEALTSQKAEEELRGRNKSYEKGDIDMLAATFILQDFLEELRVV